MRSLVHASSKEAPIKLQGHSYALYFHPVLRTITSYVWGDIAKPPATNRSFFWDGIGCVKNGKGDIYYFTFSTPPRGGRKESFFAEVLSLVFPGHDTEEMSEKQLQIFLHTLIFPVLDAHGAADPLPLPNIHLRPISRGEFQTRLPLMPFRRS